MCLLSNQNFRRFVAVLLLICLICAFMMCSVERASALDLVLTPAVIAVVGSALVACGFTFANSGEMSAVVMKFWNSIPTTVKSSFVELASSFSQVQADSPVGFITYKLSKAMVSSLSEWFASDVDSTGSVAVEYGGFPRTFSFSSSDIPPVQDSVSDDVLFSGLQVGSVGGYPIYFKQVIFTGSSARDQYCPCLVSKFFKIHYSDFGFSSQIGNYQRAMLNIGCLSIFGLSVLGTRYEFASSNLFGDNFTGSVELDSISNYADSEFGSLFFYGSSSRTYTINSGSLTDSSGKVYYYPIYSILKFVFDNNLGLSSSSDVPCDLVYGPNSTADSKADEKTDVVVSGSLLNNGSLSDTAVGSMTTTGVRDATGAETSAQTGLLSGLLDLLKEILSAITSGFSSVLDWLKSMLQSLIDAISGVASAVAEGVKAIFIPSDFAWTDFITQVQALAPTSNVDFREYSNEIEIPDITLTSKWGTQTIVDNSAIRNNIGTIRKYLGAFLTALLIIFNANMVMKFLGMASFSNNDSRVPFAPSYPNSGGGSQQALPAPNRKGGN